MSDPKTLRLDEALVELKLVSSRTRAKELIKQNKVKFNSLLVSKPALKISELDFDKIELLSDEMPYVARSAYKLLDYLRQNQVSFDQKSVLDIGASTGGFTQVALEFGAALVYAVDVGKDQLNPNIRSHERVKSFEGVNARDLLPFEKRDFDILVMDVSFISTRLLIDNVLNYLKPKSELFILFKPQFEYRFHANEYVNKDGVIKDEMSKNWPKEYASFMESKGLRLIRYQKTNIRGKKGNQEYICHFIFNSH